MTERRSHLGGDQRGQTWRSTLNGALYRWNATGWEVKFKQAPEWHAVKPGVDTVTVHAHGGEYFVPVEEIS